MPAVPPKGPKGGWMQAVMVFVAIKRPQSVSTDENFRLFRFPLVGPPSAPS